MSQYFRWMKDNKMKKDDIYLKPRSRSLDARSLEASGIRLVLQNVCTSINFHHLHRVTSFSNKYFHFYL